MLRKALIAVSMAAAMLATASARAQTVDEIVKRGEIVIGIDLTNPPWGFLDEKQEPTGFDPAYAKLVADKMGVKLKIERVNSPGRIPFLQSGRIDMVLSTLSITAERANSVRVHEKAGFRHVGRYKAVGYKFDRWLDIVHMQKAL